MYRMFKLTIEDPELATAAVNGGEPLRILCRKEVDNFDRYLREYGHEYKDGLAKFERSMLEGYLYQKLRGHLDPPNSQGS